MYESKHINIPTWIDEEAKYVTETTISYHTFTKEF